MKHQVPQAPRSSDEAPVEAPSSREVLVFLAIILFLLHQLSGILTPIIMSAAIAYAVYPLVPFLGRKLRFPRWAAVASVFIMTALVLGSGGFWIGSAFEKAVLSIGQNLPAILGRLIHDLFGPTIHVMGKTIDTSDLPNSITNEALASLQKPGWLLIGAEAVVGFPTTLVLMVVTFFYFLSAGPKLGIGLLQLMPPRYRLHFAFLAGRIDPLLRKYVRGVIVVVVYTGAVAYLVLSYAFQLPFAGMIAALVGGLEIIPVIGPAFSMILISSSALLAGHNVSALFWALGFAVALRVSIDEVLGPIVLGRFVALHPVAIILAFLIAGGLFGIAGVVLAVPVCAASKLVLQIWYGEAPAQ